MPFQAKLRCPHCRTVFPGRVGSVGVSCPNCGLWVSPSRIYSWVTFILSFVASLVASQYIGLKAYAGILWLPIFLVCLVCSWFLTAVFIPPLKVSSNPSAEKLPPSRNDLRLFLEFCYGGT